MKVKTASQPAVKLSGSKVAALKYVQGEENNSKPKKTYYGINFGLTSIVDSVLRALGRFLESSFMKEKLIVRLPFRYISETIRYGVSRMIQNIKEKKPIQDLWITGLKKSIEITFGSGFIEPNLFDERLQRVGAGFLNTIVRLIGRGGLVLSKVLSKENFNLKILLDEFVARTSARLIYFDTDNSMLRMGALTLEQLFINQWLAKLPIKEYVLPWLTKQEITNSNLQTNST